MEWGRSFVATWEKSWVCLYVDVDVPEEKEPVVVYVREGTVARAISLEGSGAGLSSGWGLHLC